MCLGTANPGHGAVRQMCLAHLLRDANYAIEEGCNGFALEFKWLLLRAISIGRQAISNALAGNPVLLPP